MTKYKILFLLMLTLAGTPLAAQASKPLIIGTTEVFHSDVLKENRNINIYLPEDYDPKKAEKYPVIYIPDGGFEEDFVHITGIVRFNNQPWINRFPQSIVVGIENTNRRRDFTFPVANTDFIEKEGFKKESFPQYGGSDKYINFLKNELQPYIEKNYNASGNRTIIGESLAGLLATGILLKNPELFSQYIIISPSLWWGEEKLLKEAEPLLRTHLKQPVKVYIGAPNKEEDTKMYAEAESLYKILKMNKNISVSFDYLPDELHSTAIHQAVYNAFKKLYPKTEYSK
ncbi:alpha/beta hydrolase [Elizabethkingia meningoseptica]|uniref:Esterase n=1 Tax=Elizabethkingia meningoseptica TaxID=238 RepID=A0A1T3ICA5_ELIME|nr:MULTISPECIES: alpha/beta hydrolase-fold protein [Elizabethkingia]AQX13733.1 esterase [Elizabethkingia meningoseptica]MBG0515530.1 alpha/beta hydrolase [Elizabethkingia meningoseptica]MCL1674742.1 alpha/beta hydrolase-fold protein [Elizabethkingia meningoseptica]MCL1685890.1 alpha/beta hydrolase-fold protein [Elizabethkingia meningoseptica]MDE5434103.1 alpha/beta hydrolase [Elizabethkingia meningoseptica]